jgi:hypothetical protein
MKITASRLRKIIKEALQEADIEDVTDIECSQGSTHSMSTCKIGGNKYYLKFSNENLFENVDPSLQILVEYLAYRIYGLYAGIKIPKPELVYDKTKKRVGLATSPASGKQASLYGKDNLESLGKKMSQGVYVDVFLANWDVIGTGEVGNVFLDDENATRIDPGGSLTFRAQGGRKGLKFGNNPGELKTMIDPSFGGAGRVFQFSDLKSAAKEFNSVKWETINTEIDNVYKEISSQLDSKGMSKLKSEWRSDVENISSALRSRHEEILNQIKEIK